MRGKMTKIFLDSTCNDENILFSGPQCPSETFIHRLMESIPTYKKCIDAANQTWRKQISFGERPEDRPGYRGRSKSMVAYDHDTRLPPSLDLFKEKKAYPETVSVTYDYNCQYFALTGGIGRDQKRITLLEPSTEILTGLSGSNRYEYLISDNPNEAPTPPMGTETITICTENPSRNNEVLGKCGTFYLRQLWNDIPQSIKSNFQEAETFRKPSHFSDPHIYRIGPTRMYHAFLIQICAELYGFHVSESLFNPPPSLELCVTSEQWWAEGHWALKINISREEMFFLQTFPNTPAVITGIMWGSNAPMTVLPIESIPLDVANKLLELKWYVPS